MGQTGKIQFLQSVVLPLNRNQGIYDKMEMDEREMFGILPNYDFSGQWLARVHNVVYDTATLDVLNAYTLDSMMLVEFVERDGGLRREILPVETYKEGSLSGLREPIDSRWPKSENTTPRQRWVVLAG